MLEKLVKNPFFRNAFSLNLLGASLILNLISWTLLLWLSSPRGEETILHYNVNFGIDYIGKWEMVFIVPFLALLIIIVNIILASYLYRNYKLLSYLLSFSSFLIQLIAILSSVLLIIQNAPK